MFDCKFPISSDVGILEILPGRILAHFDEFLFYLMRLCSNISSTTMDYRFRDFNAIYDFDTKQRTTN